MKAKDLIAKLNKLIEINPDANVYFYSDEDVLGLIGNKLLKGESLSDIELTLSRTFENGEGLISIYTD